MGEAGELVALRDGTLARGAGLPTGQGCWGTQGCVRGGEGAAGEPRLAGEGLVGVMFNGQLEQAAGLLDQQVNLGGQKRMAGEF